MKRDGRGFTLIEVLAVLAILGMLAALLTPAVGAAMARARRLRLANQLRQIAMAHASCQDGPAARRDLERATNLAEWAAALAEHSGIGDGSLYTIPDDYLALGSPPRSVLSPAPDRRPADDFARFPLAITVIVGLSPGADPSTTPLAHSRGLDPESGTWKPARGDDGGIYGTDGGWIVFLDGHVQFFHDLRGDGGALAGYGDGLPTTDIRMAVPPGARALNWKGIVWERPLR
ncbi:MAG: type II secretion system GspH family protein [Puniceicoccales bacterium]|jgi:prepilin-type N-terminal cleavage/methylation domain-containing protein|nr:type II secretion system GspH family protein [Puniceicoccales bacterium]